MTATASPRTSREVRSRVPVTPRRVVPWFVAGLLLIVAGMGAFTYWSLRASPKVPVLTVARDLPAGHVLTFEDVKVVRLAVGTDLGLVPADQQILDRPVKIPLLKGTLLTDSMLGETSYPPAGVGVVTLPVAASRFDPRVAAGARVVVVLAKAADSGADPSTGSTADSLYATVTGVVPALEGREATVSLQLGEADATAVAAQASGKDVSLILVNPAALAPPPSISPSPSASPTSEGGE
jgi:hypothetical protein